MRPYYLLLHGFFEYLGRKNVFIILYGVLTFFAFFTSQNLGYLIRLIVFLFVNIGMFFLFMSWIGTFGFWLIQMWPMRPLIGSMYMLLGGLVFPINLLPDFIFNILTYTPFAVVGYHFTLALQNKYTIVELEKYIMISAFWGMIFYLLYCYSFKKGLKKYESMGI